MWPGFKSHQSHGIFLCPRKNFKWHIKISPSIHLSVRYKSGVSHNSITNKGNLIKLHRKIKQNERVCRAQIKVPTAKVKVTIEGQRFVTYKSLVSHNSITNKGNLIKLCRKIKQTEKVCRTQNLGSQDQGQGHNRRSKICHLQIMCQPELKNQ